MIKTLMAATLAAGLASGAAFAAPKADKAGKDNAAEVQGNVGKNGNAGKKAGAGKAGKDAPKQNVGQGGGRQGSGQANFGNLISALNNISAQVQNVQALNNVNVLNDATKFVNVEDLLKGNRINALNRALNRNDVTVLQDAINDNEVFKDFLNNNNIAVNDVVTIDVLSGGNIVVYSQEQ